VICNADYYEDVLSILTKHLGREPTEAEMTAELKRRRREGQASPIPKR